MLVATQFSAVGGFMDKFIGRTSRNPNSPSAIKRRIASLRKQLAKEKRVQHLLEKEKMLQERLNNRFA